MEDGAASDAAGAPFERSASASASSPSVASFLYKSIGINIGSSMARPTRTTSRKFSLLHTSPLTRKRVIEIIGPSAEATRLIDAGCAARRRVQLELLSGAVSARRASATIVETSEEYGGGADGDGAETDEEAPAATASP